MWKIICVISALCATTAWADQKQFDLQTPDALTETGFLKHLLPRFSLKTGIRVSPVSEPGEAALGPDGTPVFREGDRIWHLSTSDSPHAQAFLDWLLSDVGKRTIEAFAPGGTALFSADVAAPEAVQEVSITGDVVLGEEISLQLCGRCHVVNHKNRMNAIGSTPSFGLMRNFDDWEGRFLAFYALKPHPAFTQVADVTDPFPANLPSPISPIEVTLEQLDAIVAYVATLEPADLGAPVRSQ